MHPQVNLAIAHYSGFIKGISDLSFGSSIPIYSSFSRLLGNEYRHTYMYDL